MADQIFRNCRGESLILNLKPTVRNRIDIELCKKKSYMGIKLDKNLWYFGETDIPHDHFTLEIYERFYQKPKNNKEFALDFKNFKAGEGFLISWATKNGLVKHHIDGIYVKKRYIPKLKKQLREDLILSNI